MVLCHSDAGGIPSNQEGVPFYDKVRLFLLRKPNHSSKCALFDNNGDSSIQPPTLLLQNQSLY
jgi:hypothetical protein